MYLWAYVSNPDRARKLAIGWFTRAAISGEFKQSADPRCAVLYAQYSAPEEACLNGASAEFEEAIFEYFEIEGLKDYSDDDINAAYEAVLTRFEAMCGQKIRVVETRVAAPKKMPYPEGKVAPAPLVYVIRDGIEEIEIVRCEEVDDTALTN